MTRRTIIGIIFVVAALLKLASMWNIIHLDWLWQHPWPEYFGVFLIFYIGVELILYSFSHDRDQWLLRPLPISDTGKRMCCAARFGADAYAFHGEAFHGARLDAFCGGVRMDLHEAVITEDEELDLHTFLGGIELIVPSCVNVTVKSHNFIGTVDDKTDKRTTPGTPCLHIVASNFLGGVSVGNED
jgi:hypothetical protein